MTATLSLVIAVVSLCLSGLIAWLTLFRRGVVRMTQPTVIYFGPDGGAEPQPRAKIYLRTLLYSTAARGQIITSMYARLRRGEMTQNFNIWVYGDDILSRGSGLFVPQTGVAYNHHFVLPQDASEFRFSSGHYVIEVFAVLAGKTAAERLFVTEIDVEIAMAKALAGSSSLGLYFDWGPDSARYHPHLRERPRDGFPEWFRNFMEQRVSVPNRGDLDGIE